MRTAGLIAIVFVLASAAAAAAATPVPAAAAKAIVSTEGTAAYLPHSVPAGYRYLRWKDATAGRAPVPGAAVFVVTFAHGSAPLLWTVTLAAGSADEQVCNVDSVGHSTVAGQAVYWGRLTTYDPLAESGPKGRHVWRCFNASGGQRLIVDLYDQGAHLAVPVLTRIVANSSPA
jgi:hypothetical protein